MSTPDAVETMAIDPIAIQSLAHVLGKDHVMGVIQDAFTRLFKQKKFGQADKLAGDFMASEFPGWVLLCAVAASYEHRDKLPNRLRLYWQAFNMITKEYGSNEARRVLAGLE